MRARCSAGLLVLLLFGASGAGVAQWGRTGRLQVALRNADASVVVLDVESGRTLFRVGDAERQASPGSTLKPFVLLTALQAHVVSERATVACRGTLNVAGHNLACSHPRDITVLDARQALAESCNTYFATLAQHMRPETLQNGLLRFGVRPIGAAQSADERVLLALGMQDVTVSTQQMAEAYRKLAIEMNAPVDEAARVVEDGMVQSVETGMAHAARVNGLRLAGKTGTVDDAGGRSHGWFAGIVFGGAQSRIVERVLVVYVPNGNGNDAAMLARRVLLEGQGPR